jgi:glycosyltransferase involved in cell wall biosynthesis
MEMAEGEYFCFLDADDEWKNDCLENFYKAIVRFSDYLVFSAAIEIETEKKQSLRNMLLLILLMIAISLRIFLKQVLNFP